MPQHRQLAAIMFTDIEGYSAIMQHNENRAMEMKDRHRTTLEKEHSIFNGRIIQYYGDGSVSIFQSAVEAVQCAIAMQQSLRQVPRVPVRMGLHMGDIISNDENIFGDGVNLASRIETLGVSGSVLISDKVNDEISNHPQLKTYSVGIYQFKNISRNVEVFALDHEGLVKPAPDSLKGKTEEKKNLPLGTNGNLPAKSIAVLPFVNMSNDPEQEYFSEGVAEEIINSLTHIQDLKVAGRISSFRFNAKSVDLREIGSKLGVSTVLEGSVRKQGNRLRVLVQLINVEDGFHLWSERYDRNIDDIFAIQDEIAFGITEKLKVTFLEKDREIFIKSHTQSTEAYELYLKGRFYINKRGAFILPGIQYFQQAIDSDPSFALAYAGYADANLLAGFFALLPSSQALNAAKQFATTALELKPSLSEPYCSLGFYYCCCEWNWVEAEKNFIKSLELNPRYVQAHFWYGLGLLAWVKGDFDKAEKHGQIAIDLEPLSANCYALYGGILHAAGKFEEALKACITGIEIDADSFLCRLYQGNSYFSLQKYDLAVDTYERLMKISNRHQFPQNALIITYCKMGQLDKARDLMNDLKKRSKTEYIASAFIGLSAAYLNDPDEAFEYLQKAYSNRDPFLLTIKYDHWVPQKLKEDPRFQQLLEKIGFP